MSLSKARAAAAGFVLALAVLASGEARCQTTCSVLTQQQLLNSFSNNVPVGSITPTTMRNLICSSGLLLSPNTFVPSQTFGNITVSTINGVVPGAGTVSGPNSSIAGDFAIFGDTTGKNIVDGGSPSVATITSGTIAGADVSGALVRATGVSAPYQASLTAIAAQSGILLDTFQQDGASDTVAAQRACSAGVPILLGARTYTINNFSTSSGCSSQFILKGIPGASIIQRTSASGSQFFQISSVAVYIDGVTFDMNKSAVTANQWGVFLGAGGQNVVVKNSVFKNNSGSLGSCFDLLNTVGSGPSAGGSFTFKDNEVTGCASNGTFFGSVSNGRIEDNYVHDNAGFGLYVSSYLNATTTNYSKDVLILHNTIERNVTGAEVGGFSPPYAFGTPGAVNILTEQNIFQDNSGSALAQQGDYLYAIANTITQSSSSVSVNTGIDSNSRWGVIALNNINLAGSSFGIDTGGSIQTPVVDNQITVTNGSAINPGGTQNEIVKRNIINVSGTAGAFTVYNIEADGNGNPFPTICSGLDIENNTVTLSGSSAGGLELYDDAGGQSGAQPTIFKNNAFSGISGSGTSNAISYVASGSALQLGGNTYNGTSTGFVNPNGSNDIVVPEVLDAVSTSSGASTTIRSVVTNFVNSKNGGSSVLYAFPVSGGSGYVASSTTLSASCSTSGPAGWVGNALIANGVITGVRVTSTGSACIGTPTVTASDTGGGTGATFSAVSVPSLLSGRQITVVSTSVTSVIQGSGGASSTTLRPTLPIIIAANQGESVTLTGGSNGWTVSPYLVPAFAISSLPPSNNTTCPSSYNGAVVNVTGSTSGAWMARCNGSNWIAPSGSTIN